MSDESDPEALEEAAFWCSVLSSGALSAEDMAELEAWLEADASNAQRLEQVSRLWMSLPSSVGSDNLIAMPRRTAWPLPPKVRHWVSGVIAVAAALVVGFVVLHSTLPISTYRGGENAANIVRLSDGSALRLEAGAVVDVDFDAARRNLRLIRGEAVFLVARDPARPFIVFIDKRAVRAVGTEFIVKRNGLATTVNLIEGELEAFDFVPELSRPDHRLVAGQRLDWPDDKTGGRIADAQGGDVVTSEQRLVLRDVPIWRAVALVNRGASSPVKLDPAIDPSQTVSGIFKVADTLTFVQAISVTRRLSYRHESSGYILIPGNIKTHDSSQN